VSAIKDRGFCNECGAAPETVFVFVDVSDDVAIGVCETCLENALAALRESAAKSDYTIINGSIESIHNPSVKLSDIVTESAATGDKT